MLQLLASIPAIHQVTVTAPRRSLWIAVLSLAGTDSFFCSCPFNFLKQNEDTHFFVAHNVFSTRWGCWRGWVCAGGTGVFKGRIWTCCPFRFQISSRCAPSLRTSSKSGRTLAGGGGNFKPWLLLCPQHWTLTRRGPSAFAAFSPLPHHSESGCLRLYHSLLPSQQEIKSQI